MVFLDESAEAGLGTSLDFYSDSIPVGGDISIHRKKERERERERERARQVHGCTLFVDMDGCTGAIQDTAHTSLDSAGDPQRLCL